MKLREQRYRDMEQAKIDAMEAMRRKITKPPKWMRKKKKSIAV
jgi:hypothetical protein